VSGTVNVGNFPANFPAAPTTVEIASNFPAITPPGVFLIPRTDVSAYRELTLYIKVISVGSGTATCSIHTFDQNGTFIFQVDTFTIGSETNFTKTIDPAPPNIEVGCDLTSGTDVPLIGMLVGRTG
jgi:hypothetical protein